MSNTIIIEELSLLQTVVMRKRILLFLIFSVFIFGDVFSQSKEVEKILYRAERLLRIKNYREALNEYLEAIKQGDSSPLTHYYTGVCYINMPNTDDQIKAKPYFEFALNKKDNTIPNLIYYELGQVYHKDMEVARAMEMFSKYRNLLDTRDPKRKDVEEQIRICDNASILLSSPRNNIIIRNLGPEINTPDTEYNPVVSADESVLAFTRLSRSGGPSASARNMVEQIFITNKKSFDKSWPAPSKLHVETKFNVGTAGISPDGENMLIFISGLNNTGNLYSIQRTMKGWSNPVTLGSQINSGYLESTASITPDGNTIYFASNRPGGYGGMDIYKIEKEKNGNWGHPKNLGSTINTKYDEDAPFIHPDQKTLFFTSNGHNTMGGQDIFRTILVEGVWGQPENLGFPINTPANDNYFTLTADGRKGYFSSDRAGGFGGQDIYTFDMPEEDANIPLTLIKGRILAGEALSPVPTEIIVVDNDTNRKIPYVYNPNKETGNYLIIFPPGKNYDIIIESEGYMPYTINTNIPNQTYFYELYQEINLRPIKHFDIVVGQEVTVKNVFFDTGKEVDMSVRMANEAMLVRSDSIDLFELMNAIIGATDSAAMEYLLELMYTTHPIDSIDFDKYTRDIEAAKRIYYYDESDTSRLEVREVEGQLIYSLPTLYVTEENTNRIIQQATNITYNQQLLEPVYKIYFDVNQSLLKQNYHVQLNELLKIMNQHEDLGIEISGYASYEGDAEHNRKLSNQRAIEVLNYFNHKGIVRRRIKAIGHGAAQNSNVNREESRKVEIRLVDLNDYAI
jgi:outer membrane protein OmpA-like peptidoglycan-associated protein/tetratricopeptide (TPR) repeat protein